ncbi:antibiotic biosynthesis monooxygenase [Calditrichota bacterium]
MITTMINHEVEDFSKWISAYEEHAKFRRESGALKSHVFQATDNPNHVTVVIHWETLVQMETFLQSPELRQAMTEAGVKGEPTVKVLNSYKAYDF